jgi:cytochrome c oxidase subunit 2
LKKLLLVGSIVAMMALAGCGSNSKPGEGANAGASAGSGEGKTITIHATNFDFNESEYRVKKGEKVKVVLVNDQGNHGIDIKGLDVSIKKNNGTAEFTADKAGEYEIVCSIMCGTGHNDMVAKFIVEE